MHDEGGFADTLAATESAPAPAARRVALARGTTIGRYVLLERVGAGGMGVVFAAYDPQLDRRVALKLMRFESDASSVAARVRFLREAQAMARLDHPNVVAVHDVGEDDGQVFLAMEFVEGRTLARWRDEAARGWREVLAVYVAAGRGLAAAHAKGLVHRDFKPENVLVDRGGIVRVVDFGLARVGGDVDSSTLEEREEIANVDASLETTVTRVGVAVGTLVYMAPEQIRGKQVGPAADQFSFCVALYEALYGLRPFAGTHAPALLGAISAGRIREPERDVDVPRWLRRELVRGLQPRAEHRHASMDDLLAALARDPSRRRRRIALAAGVVALGVGVFAWTELDRRARREGCERASEGLDATWNPSRRAAAEAGMLATGVPYAPTTAAAVGVRLDDWRARWAEVTRDTCTAREVDRSVADDRAQAIEGCLDDAAAAFGGFVDDLGQPDEIVLTRAILVAAGLPEPERCRDAVPRIARAVAVDPDEQRRIRRAIVRANVVVTARPEDVVANAETLLAEAAALGDPSTHAMAGMLLSRAYLATGDYTRARARLLEAERVAGAAEIDDTAAEIAQLSCHVIGYRLREFEAGLGWCGIAQMWLDRQGAPAEHPIRAHVATARGNILRLMGRLDDAEREHASALAIWEAIGGADHPDVATSLNNLGNVAIERHASAEAIELQSRALEIRRRLFGSDHPLVAISLNNLGAAVDESGDLERALRLFEESTKIAERIHGPDHPDVLMGLDNQADELEALGRAAEAVPLRERVLVALLRREPADAEAIAEARAALEKARAD